MAKQRRRTHSPPAGAPRGWLVKTGQGYYTGNQRSELECWTAFPRLAKVYHRQGWAQKVAVRLAGQVIAVGAPDGLPFASKDGAPDGKR